MKRLLPVLAAVVLAGACSGGGGDIAATVNGVDIEVATVQGLIDNGDEPLTDAQFRSILTALVQWSAVADAARDQFNIDPTDDEVSEFADGILAAQGAGLTREEFIQAQQITEAGFVLSADRLLVEERILAELEAEVDMPTIAAAEQTFADDPQSWTVVCAAHILVATAEEATAVQERLEAGEDFASVAVALSLDTGSGAAGGDLGCSAPSGWVAPFAEATMTSDIGTVTEPVETQFGFHLIRVDSRTQATAEEIQQTLFEAAKAENAETWFLDAVVAAQITIAEQYGTWETDPIPAIAPPAS